MYYLRYHFDFSCHVAIMMFSIPNVFVILLGTSFTLGNEGNNCYIRFAKNTDYLLRIMDTLVMIVKRHAFF